MTKDMTTGNPLKLMLLFTLPVLIGNIFQQLYNMVDAIIVGQFLGADALGAVGAVGSLMFLVLGFANGLAQGFGVAVSHAFGAKDGKLLKHYVALSLMLTVIISVILTIPTLLHCRELLLWLNTPADIIDMGEEYLTVIFAGIIFTMAYNVAAGILRGIGDSKTPLYFLIFSSVLNVFLDLFMIVVLKMGTAGAAYATVISQGVSAFLCFVYMFWKFEILRTTRQDYYFDFASMKKMLSIGIPMALNYSITALGLTVMQAAVNVFGSGVVAAYTAASKVFNLVMQIPSSLGVTMSTYCGQNLGAQKYDRIYQGLRYGFFLSFAIAIVSFVCCVQGGNIFIRLFLTDPSEEILYYGMHYLKIVSVFFTFLSWIFVYRCSLQGLDQGFIPMVSGLLEFAVRYVVIRSFSEKYGYTAVCLADPVTWIATAALLMAAYYHWKYKQKKRTKRQDISEKK